MRNPLLAVILSLGVISPVLAGDVFSFHIDGYPASAPRGFPIEIIGKIQNVSGNPVLVGVNLNTTRRYDYDFGYFSIFAAAGVAGGVPTELCHWERGSGIGDYVVVGPVAPDVLPVDWQDRFQLPVCIDGVGVHRIVLVAHGRGPFIDPYTKKEYEVWTGRAVSAPVTIEIKEPTGVDREAYDYFNGALFRFEPHCAPRPANRSILVAKFPTSTYTAYVAREFIEAKGVAETDAGRMADRLRWGLRIVARHVPCPPGAGCDPNKELVGQNTAEQAIDWSARWIDIVLKAHPDIWFADELRLRLALDEFIEGKSSLGASDLETLSKAARPDIAEKAGQLLTLVKQKGLVK